MATFDALLRKAKKEDAYWREVAVLDFTSDLSQMLKDANMTRSELAKRINSSRAYITKVFRGDANFTIETMVKLVRAAGGELHIEVRQEIEPSIEERS